VALYNEEVPVIFVNGEKAFRYRVDAVELRRMLDSVGFQPRRGD
jgi:hypothetical protein